MTDLTSELNALQQDADTTLGNIETGLRTAVDAGNLPLVGDAVKNSFDATSTLHAAESLNAAIDSGIQAALSLIAGNPAADAQQTITQAINDALAAQGFGQGVVATVGSQGVDLQFADSKTVADTVSVASNLGLSGLSLQTQGQVEADLTYNFNFTLGDDAANPANYYVVASGSPLVSVNATVSAPNFSADADLGFLHFSATSPSLDANIAINTTRTTTARSPPRNSPAAASSTAPPRPPACILRRTCRMPRCRASALI
jgi:hypothetical protein